MDVSNSSTCTPFVSRCGPIDCRVNVRAASRLDIYDICQHPLFRAIPSTFRYVVLCSMHTTAGFIDRSLAVRLRDQHCDLHSYIGAFRAMFPEGADYAHDHMELRSELSPSQRLIEPRNADAHLVFIAAGLSNCVRYPRVYQRGIHMIDLDGVSDQSHRERTIRIAAFNQEVGVEKFSLAVDGSTCDQINLRDDASGVYDRIQRAIRRHRIARGRVLMSLDKRERDAGLTINEYEPQLMESDVAGIIGKASLGPRFALSSCQSRNHSAAMLGDGWRTCPSSIAPQTAALPIVRVRRRISLLVSQVDGGEAGIVEGKYQSPILIQWRGAPRRRRTLHVTLTRFK